MKAFPCEWSEWDSTKKVMVGDSMNGFIEATGSHVTKSSTGMDLRDYFAAKAMQSYWVGNYVDEKDICAEWAYEVADAMMEARNATK